MVLLLLLMMMMITMTMMMMGGRARGAGEAAGATRIVGVPRMSTSRIPRNTKGLMQTGRERFSVEQRVTSKGTA